MSDLQKTMDIMEILGIALIPVRPARFPEFSNMRANAQK